MSPIKAKGGATNCHNNVILKRLEKVTQPLIVVVLYSLNFLSYIYWEGSQVTGLVKSLAWALWESLPNETSVELDEPMGWQAAQMDDLHLLFETKSRQDACDVGYKAVRDRPLCFRWDQIAFIYICKELWVLCKQLWIFFLKKPHIFRLWLIMLYIFPLTLSWIGLHYLHCYNL